MRTLQITPTLFVAGLCLFSSCRKEGEQPKHPEQAPAATNRIAVPESVRKNLGIAFVKVERRRIAHTLRFPGSFELMPTARHELRAPIAGRVTLAVHPLQNVKSGDVIARIDSPAWRDMQRELNETATQVRVAEARIAAMQPLIEAHATHEASLLEAIQVTEANEANVTATQASVGGQSRALAEVRSQLAQARAALAEAAEKRAEITANLADLQANVIAGRDRFSLSIEAASAVAEMSAERLVQDLPGAASRLPAWRVLGSIDVHAVTDGIVEQLSIASGGWAETGSLIATVSDLTQVRFRARGLQSDLLALKGGLPALAIPAFGTQAAESRVMGRLLLGAEADPGQRTLDLFLEPTLTTAWSRPGVAGFLEIETDSAVEAELSIPLAATLQDGLQRVLFRRDPADPDRVIRLDADLGLDDGRWVAVKSGIRDGDEVVLAGAYELMLASSGTAPKGGHVHADGTFHEGEHK